MSAPITHFLPITLIRRERILPVPGKVLVRTQQKVAAIDTIAEANIQPEFIMLDIARGLGVSTERADRFIQFQVNDQLAEGDMVAGPVGLTRRVIRSPRSGRVALVGNGQVLVELSGKPVQIKAGLPGTVAELISDRGAVIETTGALIQGVWGNGRVDSGVMNVLAKAPDQEFTMSDIDISSRGSIVMAAHCADSEVLKYTDELPLRGLILASMTPDLIPIAKKLRTPVIVIEGFGHRPMNSLANKLLVTNDRREIAINAEPWNRYAGTRPEVIIPLPAPSSVSTPQEVGTFGPGKQVRILCAPHASEIGKIVGLKGGTLFPSGLRSTAAEVLLGSGEKQLFPVSNLELLA